MLEVKNVSKSFNNVVVFNNISFNLEKKDRLAIIGPSGCGKSTLLRCINKLETPDTGSIVIDGIDILDKKTNLEEVRKKIGMVFQQFKTSIVLSASDPKQSHNQHIQSSDIAFQIRFLVVHEDQLLSYQLHGLAR